MTDDDNAPRFSLLEKLKRRIIDDLLKVLPVGGGNAVKPADVEAQRKKVLAVLKKHDQELEKQQAEFQQFDADAKALQAFVNGGQRTLDQILVGKSSWKFESMTQLEEKFGKPRPGYTYWPLAESGDDVSENEANDASNFVRLPTLLAEELEERRALAADEFGGQSLRAWLRKRSLEPNQIWAYRLLTETGILKEGSVPPSLRQSSTQKAAPAGGSVPSVGSRSNVPPRQSSAITVDLQNFANAAIAHYDADNGFSFEEAERAVARKVSCVRELDGAVKDGRMALVPLLEHPDFAVRVSAATYLLAQLPDRVVPMLKDISAINSPVELKQPHAQWAATHARQALWVFEDGMLDI